MFLCKTVTVYTKILSECYSILLIYNYSLNIINDIMCKFNNYSKIFFFKCLKNSFCNYVVLTELTA